MAEENHKDEGDFCCFCSRAIGGDGFKTTALSAGQEEKVTICRLCAKTYVGNILRYPTQYDETIRKVIHAVVVMAWEASDQSRKMLRELEEIKKKLDEVLNGRKF